MIVNFNAYKKTLCSRWLDWINDEYVIEGSEELKDSYGEDKYTISNYYLDYMDFIIECKNDNMDAYDCATELQDKEYYIRYKNYHTAITNVLSFGSKDDVISALQLIEDFGFDLDEDFDRESFYNLTSELEYDDHEINFRFIKTFELNCCENYDGTIILDESDIATYNDLDKFLKKQELTNKYKL